MPQGAARAGIEAILSLFFFPGMRFNSSFFHVANPYAVTKEGVLAAVISSDIPSTYFAPSMGLADSTSIPISFARNSLNPFSSEPPPEMIIFSTWGT